MIKVEEIAKQLENGLNGYQDKYTFDIAPLVGDWKPAQETRKKQLRELPKIVINGILLALPSGIVPIKNLKNFYIIAQFQIQAKEEYANELYEILQNYIEARVGTSERFGEYVGTVNFDVPSIGQLDIEPGAGASVPIMTTVYWQFIAGGVITEECALTIDSEEIAPNAFTFVRTRVTDTGNILGSGEMQSVVGQQGLVLSVVMPYIKNSLIAKKLVADCIGGGLSTYYNVSYNDGVASQVDLKMIAESINVNYQAQKIPLIEVKLVIARSDLYGGN